MDHETNQRLHQTLFMIYESTIYKVPSPFAFNLVHPKYIKMRLLNPIGIQSTFTIFPFGVIDFDSSFLSSRFGASSSSKDP